jgi:hypothetical protein
MTTGHNLEMSEDAIEMQHCGQREQDRGDQRERSGH